MESLRNAGIPQAAQGHGLPSVQKTGAAAEQELAMDCTDSLQSPYESDMAAKGMILPPAVKTPPPTITDAFTGQKDPHRGVLAQWLQRSIIGLFVGLTIMGATGCTKIMEAVNPPKETGATEQVVAPKTTVEEITSNEQFKTVGKEILGNLSNIVHRYGGDFYGKTDKGMSDKPMTTDEAYDAIAKGGSFYFKGSSSSDPVEIASVKDLNSVYKEVLKEAAAVEAGTKIDEMAESLKSTEFGQKVMGHMSELAQKHGGNLYSKTAKGMSEKPVTPAAAYADLASGKSIFFKGSATSEPVEIKNIQQLGVVYKEVASTAAVSEVTAEGVKWIEESLKTSEGGQKIITHLTEITKALGGNIYGKTAEGPSSAPVTAAEAYQKLSKGESVYLRVTRDGNPIEISSLQQLGTIYQEATGELTNAGMQAGVDWATQGIKDSKYTKAILVQINEIAAKSGGEFYTQGKDGSKTAVTPLEAFESLSGGKSFFIRTSKDAAPVEIKQVGDVVGAYINALTAGQQGSTGSTASDALGNFLQGQLNNFLKGKAADPAR